MFVEADVYTIRQLCQGGSTASALAGADLLRRRTRCVTSKKLARRKNGWDPIRESSVYTHNCETQCQSNTSKIQNLPRKRLATFHETIDQIRQTREGNEILYTISFFAPIIETASLICGKTLAAATNLINCSGQLGCISLTFSMTRVLWNRSECVLDGSCSGAVRKDSAAVSRKVANCESNLWLEPPPTLFVWSTVSTVHSYCTFIKAAIKAHGSHSYKSTFHLLCGWPPLLFFLKAFRRKARSKQGL